MGYIPREWWPGARREWIDDKIDRESGARELRIASRRLKRCMILIAGRLGLFTAARVILRYLQT